MTYIKKNVEEHEYTMHKYVYDLNIVNTPKIISYNKEEKILTMEKIDNMNVSDMYGEENWDTNPELFAKIRKIIKTLCDNNIEYPDITGYNFIEYDDKVWIIDFEHSKISKKITNSFIKKFIKGLDGWNPDFR